MLESTQSLGIVETPWQFYYLGKKRRTEQTLRRFVGNIDRSDLTPSAHDVLEHGILRTKGKRVRPVLTYLVHDLVRGNNPYIDDLAILAELPHRGSLLEDDIDDNARQRDGKLPAFRLYGREATMEAVTFLYNSPRMILSALPINEVQRQRLMDEYIRLSKKARQGQERDVAWGRNSYIPSIEEYWECVKISALPLSIQLE